METNIVRSKKPRKPSAETKKTRPRKKRQTEGIMHSPMSMPTEEEDEGYLSDPVMEGNSDIEEEEESDVSDYDMSDVSGDDSGSDSEETGIFDEGDDEDSDADMDEELTEGCKVVSVEEAEKLVSSASKLKEANVRRLVVVYGSFIRREALKMYPPSDDASIRTKDELNEKGSQKKQRNRSMASRSLSDKFKNMANRYAPSCVDVYNYVALETFAVMEAYLKSHTLSFSNKHIVEVAMLLKRFLSSCIVQLGFHYEDVDLCKCALDTLGKNTVMPWLLALKSVHRELVKVACSIMARHSASAVRIYAFQLLQCYGRSLDESKYHRIQISQSPSTGTKVERLTPQQANEFRNHSLNFMFNRSYRTHISAASTERTLQNFGLFKLSQNCLAELYNEASTCNLYTFAFKSIRDLGINVRREWLAINDKKKRDLKSDKDSSHFIVLPVYSWGFVEAINIWVAVLSKCKSKLHLLAYPLVVVINAAIKIKLPNIEYLPFVIHMMTAQNQLADGMERFIPLVSLIFNIMEQLKNKDLSKMKRTEAKTSRKLLDNADDIMLRLKLSKKQLHASETYVTIYRYLELVLTDHIGLISLHPSFPEFTIPVLSYLKRYLKKYKVENGFRNSLTKLVKLITESVKVVQEKRSEMDLTQRSIQRLKVLLSDAKSIPIYKQRINLLLKFQNISKEKVLGTLSAANL